MNALAEQTLPHCLVAVKLLPVLQQDREKFIVPPDLERDMQRRREFNEQLERCIYSFCDKNGLTGKVSHQSWEGTIRTVDNPLKFRADDFSAKGGHLHPDLSAYLPVSRDFIQNVTQYDEFTAGYAKAGSWRMRDLGTWLSLRKAPRLAIHGVIAGSAYLAGLESAIMESAAVYGPLNNVNAKTYLHLARYAKPRRA